MKTLIIIILNAIFLSVFCQNALIIEGEINNTDGKSIPFATISMLSTLSATTSDIDGKYTLVIAKNSLPDTLIVRHISFKTQKIYLEKRTSDITKPITLLEKSVNINSANVFALTSLSIIQKAIENINTNYDKNYFLYGFYRQKHRENNKFVRLIEAFVDIKETINERNDDRQKESYLIRKIRRSNIYERNGDKHGDHLVDLFNENPINYSKQSFLNKNNIYNYNFSRLESKNANHFKIYFQNKDWQMPHNKSGYIIINKKDFAILEIKIVSTKNPSYKKVVKSNWKFQNGNYQAFYEERNSKYYCKKSSKYYNHYVLNEQTNKVDFIVEEFFDWYTLSINPKTKYNFPFKIFSNLYSIDYKYDTSFWNTIKIPSIHPKVISDLNNFKDLELQFIND